MKTPSARVRSRVAAHATPMIVMANPMPDPANPSLNLQSTQAPGGHWAIRVPLAAFPMQDFAPGSMVTVVLGIQQTHMEPAEPDKPLIILPGDMN